VKQLKIQKGTNQLYLNDVFFFNTNNRGRIFVELQTIIRETQTEPLGDISNSDFIHALLCQCQYQSQKHKLHGA